jgi:PEP-CTERM/exosortase A-associated glycosyltransferase
VTAEALLAACAFIAGTSPNWYRGRRRVAIRTIMKILHILDHSIPLHSGYAFRSQAILREQRALGWQTFQLTTPKHAVAGRSVEEIDGWLFYRTRPLGPLVSRLPVLRDLTLIAATAGRLEAVARRVRPDILHAHSPALNGIAALLAGGRLGLPVVCEVRGLWEDAAVDHGTTTAGSLRYRTSRAIETFALRRCHAVTTICEGLRGDLLARGLPTDKITVVPNAVDTAAFPFAGERDDAPIRALGLTGKTVLGFIGSFYAYEGLDLLIEALPMILARRPEAVLLLVGGGPAEAALRRLAGARGLDQAVRFVGRVPHDEVSRYYDLADILVYPRHSMRLTELVTPLKPLEAMARGRIVLASDVGGHRELIRDGETGYLFAADDARALADRVVDIVARTDERTRVRENARRFVESERTWQRSVARYRHVYERAIAAKRGGG